MLIKHPKTKMNGDVALNKNTLVGDKKRLPIYPG